MRFRNSFWTLLNCNTAGAPEAVMESVRKAMYAAVDTYCDDDRTGINRRIDNAKHIAEL